MATGIILHLSEDKRNSGNSKFYLASLHTYVRNSNYMDHALFLTFIILLIDQ